MANKPIIIQNDGRGIGASSYVGFEEIRNLNISDKPGVFFANPRLDRATADSGEPTAVTAFIRWMTRGYRSSDGKTYYFAIDENGQIYRTVPSTSDWVLVTGNSAGNGPGLAFWKDHLFAARKSYLETYDFSSWQTDWEAIDDQQYQHPMLAGSDDILWGGAGRYIFKLQENDGYTFGPGTSASYTFTKQALDLPSGYIVTCLAEFNEYLLIGTENLNDANTAEVFVWDRTDPSFSKTIQINNSDRINWIEVYNNRVYIQAGNRGEIFVSDSTNAYLFAKMPASLIESYGGLAFYPDSSMIFNNKLYFAPSADTGAGVSSAIGVYSVDLNTGVINIENTISTGESGENGILRITALIPKGSTDYYVAWQDDNTSDFGIDSLNVSGNVYYNSEAYFISQFFNVGTRQNKRTFISLYIQLIKDLTTGQSVTVYYRENKTDTWVSIATFNSVGESSFEAPFRKTLENVQFKVVFDSPNNSTDSPNYLLMEAI